MITDLKCAPPNTTGCEERRKKVLSIFVHCHRKVCCGNKILDFFLNERVIEDTVRNEKECSKLKNKNP